jgi:hypothetical protein
VELSPARIQKRLEEIDLSQIAVLKERYRDPDSLWSLGERSVFQETTSDGLKLLWQSYEKTSEDLDDCAIRLVFISLMLAGWRRYMIRTGRYKNGTKGRGKTESSRSLDTVAMHILDKNDSTYPKKRRKLQKVLGNGKTLIIIVKIFGVAFIYLLGAHGSR